MAKFHGIVGFVEYAETGLDIYKEIPSEKEYSGDFTRKSYRSVSTQQSINDNLVINNQLEIIADPYMSQHFPSIKYVKWRGTNWKVTSADDTNFPRIVLNLGEVYNGPTATEVIQDSP